VIVEITPIGIKNLGWQFWIVWTVFNAIFLPIIYFFYPETCKQLLDWNHITHTNFYPANHSLEDLDDYYRSNPTLIVTRDPDAVSAKRPQKYIAREEEEVVQNRRQSVRSTMDATPNKV
jgi:hypothetical protein